MKSPAAATGSQCETTYLDCRWFSVWMSASFTPHLVVQFSSGEKAAWHKSCGWREEDDKNRWRSATRRVLAQTLKLHLFIQTSLVSVQNVLLCDILASGFAAWWTTHPKYFTLDTDCRGFLTLTLNLISTTSLLCYNINNNDRPFLSDVWSENTKPQIQKNFVVHKWI